MHHDRREGSVRQRGGRYNIEARQGNEATLLLGADIDRAFEARALGIGQEGEGDTLGAGAQR